ncbi:flavin reductase family protein [Streptomyces sp. MBT65]|uniref:flavin reductase family protein n=1 Tax=Streptomyces sp. MBT65 TaxID=1488395 RepID=UPI00190CC191|nr:flavin reductase family protein [Streptomyces sp. MBT65]MBK3576104.1 flavin reductase family protein [Streptomyces sp. MBT65]
MTVLPVPRDGLAEPVSGDRAEASTLAPDPFHRFMRTWATGITVVTTRRAERLFGCTVTAFTSVSLRPALLLVSLARGSRTLAAVQERGVFAVNVLPDDLGALADRFATMPGDRFATVAHRLVEGVPVLEEAMASVVCRVHSAVPVADHMLVLGHPVDYGGFRESRPLLRFDGRTTTSRSLSSP